MKTPDSNIIPAHAGHLPGDLSGFPGFKELINYQELLAFRVAEGDDVYLAIASSLEGPERETSYFLTAASRAGLVAYRDGKLTFRGLVEAAGGEVYYSFDTLKTFKAVAVADMCDDDAIVLPCTGKDYHDLFDEIADGLA